MHFHKLASGRAAQEPLRGWLENEAANKGADEIKSSHADRGACNNRGDVVKKYGRLVRAGMCVGLGLGVLAAASAQVSAASAGRVTVHDLRTPAQKEARRDSNFSALYFLADRTIKPDAMGQLQEALQRHVTAGDLNVEVRELAIVDFFPHRLGSGPAGLVPNLITRGLMDGKTDWTFVQDMHVPTDQDSVICVASAAINGAAAKASAYVPYQLKGFAVMVHSNKGFRNAVSACFEKLAPQLLDSAKVAQ